jgi:diguanylate cyclase (GGDEF)-like protein
METPKRPVGETRRLAALRSLTILDTAPEERFDRLTRLASRLFEVPIALVSLVDENRQWFKSKVGLDVCETPRDISFCGHAILYDEILHVSDTHLDARFQDNPLVTKDPHIRFYAGCPLRTQEGDRLGTLCLIDRVPRVLSDDFCTLLRDLAAIVEREISAVQMATLDDLTGLSNRRGFESLGRHALHNCRQFKRPARLLMFDLDEFKPINDRYGHAEGDFALRQFSSLLTRSFSTADILARIGGDEFAVLVSGTQCEKSAECLINLAAALEQSIQNEHRGYELKFSVGTVDFDPHSHESLADLLAAGDREMYRNKHSSRR